MENQRNGALMDFNQASAFVAALTGDVNSVMDWRAINDRDRMVQAHNARGTLAECWEWLCAWNAKSNGIFAVINETNGQGASAHNVTAIRAHFIDLDNLSAMVNLARACEWWPKPAFAVQSSPNKAHVYWPVERYADASRFVSIQKRLIAHFDGDPVIHDLPRVMRVPGFYHCKGEPVLTTCYALPGYNDGRIDSVMLDIALAGVVVHESTGARHALGDASKAAPSLDWIKLALANVDPNTLDRGEWIAFTCAIKQAAWTLADASEIYALWSEWCARYDANDPGENLKQWNSIRNTELGWQSIVRRVPAVHAQLTLGPSGNAPSAQALPVAVAQDATVTYAGELLTAIEQRDYFKGCVFVARMGEILIPNGRLMNANKFNGQYGGKKFIIDEQSKLTNEPWQAALRSTLWTIPKVDHLRFIPTEAKGAIVVDELGREGVNTYIPARIRTVAGDPSPFLRHMEAMFPIESDRKILFDFLAHNAKYPGYKIPWAPLLQSAEGVGKGVIKTVVRHMMGGPYVHFPNAQELIASGSKFNAWMRAKLFILVDEIKVDERRDMIEVLKPMISEKEIEIQGKGHDQEKEDNYSNWCFFSNYKDAIPVNSNARRFAIFYSAIQSKVDLNDRGMTGDYFDKLYAWLNGDGAAIVTHWLREYPIACGDIPMRAPDTSSTAEATRQSRGPYEVIITEAIEDGIQGFKGGYVSNLAASVRIKAGTGKPASSASLVRALEAMGYVAIGRDDRVRFNEDPTARATIYALNTEMKLEDYATAQGY